MTTTVQRHYYWQRLVDASGNWASEYPHGPPGADLARIRRGAGREAGSVPEMWRFYTQLHAEGHLTDRLRAEHITLTLFAIHQQSKNRPMHRPGVGIGRALAELRRSDDYRENAERLDTRFAAAATSSTLGEVSVHLRGLVTLLRGKEIPFDYTQLWRDLRGWNYADAVAGVRRRWGAHYFSWQKDEQLNDEEADSTEPTGGSPEEER